MSDWRPPAMLEGAPQPDPEPPPARGDEQGPDPLRGLMITAAALGRDELRVLYAIAERLRMGRDQYGPLDIERDPRDWDHEGGEEAADLLVYRTIAKIARGTR